MEKHRARILIVEDERSMREVLKILLEGERYEVVSASDGLEGLSYLANDFFDLVITDIKMPKFDGFEVLKKTKEISPDTIVIMITAFGTTEAAIEAMNSGAYDYINKPQKSQKLPVVMWAYPREFTDPSAAGQITGSPHRFTTLSGASHLLLLTQGYAIFDNPTMPIIGPGETANDHYVEQLVASAQAAVDKVVELGVGERQRIGVGGHSYGAFMTANLLAHSDLFRAGIARSGAYNRTLTPFGFQNERRTFWEVPDVYGRMSPFWFAQKVNEPILLTHGEVDNNSGTFPIQSERFYMALKGHGATVR